MIKWGYRENKKNAKVKRAQFTPDHHEINLNLIRKAQQGSFLGLTGPLRTQICRI